MNRHTWALAALLALGCGDKDGEDTGAGGGDPAADCADPFCVEWTDGAVVLSITGGSGEHWFGMAETGCADPDSCWYGEDCVYGDLTGGYNYCHPAGETGVSLHYGGDFASLLAAQETVFAGPEFEPAVTYYVESSASGEC